jgi:uncharacterized membrane protein
MRSFIVVGVVVVVAAFAAGSWSLAIAQEPSESTEQVRLEFFESKIRPVLVQHCYECHSADAKNIKGGTVARYTRSDTQRW